MSTPRKSPQPGAYRFLVKSAEEAVSVIHEKLGPQARVLSVRSVEPRGLRRLFRMPHLEVIAQVDAVVPERMVVDPAREFSSTVSSAGLMEPDPRTPLLPPAGLASLLRRSGLTETALDRLQARPVWSELNTLPLHRALAETSRLLCEDAGARSPRAPISRAAFLGAPGVGRTTALCKWLAIEVFRRGRRGHVVSVEFDRPNLLGQLPVYSEAIGVPFAHFPCATRSATPGGFVYMELPGLSVRRPSDNAPIAEFLDREQITERVLVLNAAYDRAAMRDAYAAGKDLGATHLAFTHLDEVRQWGKLWDYLFDEDLEPLLLATGPSLTGDCEEDVPGAIARRTLPDN